MREFLFPAHAALGAFLLLAACGAGAPVPRERAGIVSMAPHLTEALFALGQGERLAAVGDFDDYPPEAAALPKAGGYIDPNFEKILMLQPELLVLPGRHPALTRFAELNAIPVLNVNMDSLEGIDAGLALLGEALDCAPEAEALRARLRAGTEALRAALEGRPRPRVFIATTREPGSLTVLNTSGGASFVSEIVTLAGGDNIFGEASQAYFSASKETLVLAAPEVILEFQAGARFTPEEIAAVRAEWSALPTLPAVRDGRIHILTESHFLRPGPRILEVAREIAGLLHPEAVLP